MSSLSLIFIDGWGIGKDAKDSNPYFHALTPFLDHITDGYGLRQPFPPIIKEHFAVLPTDACLGVAGLPQSATGQTAIVTGVNAPLLMGRHINGYPGSDLRKIIASTNVMQTTIDLGLTTFLINAYSPEYFDMIRAGKRKHAVFALMALAAGVPFSSLDDMQCDESIYQDITNHLLRKRGHDVPVREPTEAGLLYGAIAKKYDFSVFEYFQTDTVGHKKDMKAAVSIYETLDLFFTGIMKDFDSDEDALIIVSDHGNIEDVSTGSHTRNPVPTILLGKRAVRYASMIKDITDISFLVRMILTRGK
jgi:2,3-bisphosphoglycerate-independent phosphoglycerate mutase